VVFNATFNNISVISWRLVLSVEKTTGLPQVTPFDLIYLYLFQLILKMEMQFNGKRTIVTGAGKGFVSPIC
jgi:hypothetical protein